MLKHLAMFKISVVKMVCICLDIKPLPYPVCVCHRHSLFLSTTVYVCQRQSRSVTDRCRLSQKIFVCQRKTYVCHRHYVSITDSVCLSPTVFFTVPLCFSKRVCVCHNKFFLSVILCLYQTLLSIIISMVFFFFFKHDFHQDFCL